METKRAELKKRPNEAVGEGRCSMVCALLMSLYQQDFYRALLWTNGTQAVLNNGLLCSCIQWQACGGSAKYI